MISFAPLRPMSGGWTEAEPTPAAASSLWVSTASTPGIARAAVVSIDFTMACACGEAHEDAARLILLRRILDEPAEPPHQRAASSTRGSKMVMVVLVGRCVHGGLAHSPCQSYRAIK